MRVTGAEAATCSFAYSGRHFDSESSNSRVLHKLVSWGFSVASQAQGRIPSRPSASTPGQHGIGAGGVVTKPTAHRSSKGTGCNRVVGPQRLCPATMSVCATTLRGEEAGCVARSSGRPMRPHRPPDHRDAVRVRPTRARCQVRVRPTRARCHRFVGGAGLGFAGSPVRCAARTRSSEW